MCKRSKLLPLLFLLGTVASCDLLDGGLSGKSGQDDTESENGVLSIRFLENTGQIMTKSGTSVIIDTNSFILTVSDSDGNVLYDGTYSEAPVSLIVKPGSYDVSAVSSKFTKPAFESPQWGDQQCVTVTAGRTSVIDLVCRQMNSGIRMSISSDFLESYPGSSLFLKSSDGKLMYSYSEKRTAYFQPGTVSLMMSTGSKDETLLSRNLCSGEILALQIKVASGASDASGTTASRISISVDTTRTYINETYVIGGSGSGDDSDKGKEWSSAYTISQARTNIGKKGVWVGGYIVGGDLTNKGISFDDPFSSSSNLAIGPRSNTSTRNDCLSVQLQSGDIRDEINLVSNPSMLHRYVYFKGDIVDSYFGLVGIKNLTDYKMQ